MALSTSISRSRFYWKKNKSTRPPWKSWNIEWKLSTFFHFHNSEQQTTKLHKTRVTDRRSKLISNTFLYIKFQLIVCDCLESKFIFYSPSHMSDVRQDLLKIVCLGSNCVQVNWGHMGHGHRKKGTDNSVSHTLDWLTPPHQHHYAKTYHWNLEWYHDTFCAPVDQVCQTAR